MFILLLFYRCCDYSISKVKEKNLTLGVVNKLNIVQVFRNYICKITLFLLECHLKRLKSSWQKLDRQKWAQWTGFQRQCGWKANAYLACGYRVCAFNLSGQQMAAACHLHMDPLGNPSPTRADWEAGRLLPPFPVNPGEGVLCQLMASVPSTEAWCCLSRPPLAFVLSLTWIYMGDRRLEPKAFKTGRDEKNYYSLKLVGAFCSLELIFVLWGCSLHPCQDITFPSRS